MKNKIFLKIFAVVGICIGGAFKGIAQYQSVIKVKANINPGAASANPANFKATSNIILGTKILYFTADNGTNGTELWKTNGTSAGTVMVADISNVGAASSNPLSLEQGPGINTVYFSASDGTNGRELWKSDGTAAGTVMVKNITADDQSSAPKELTYCNGVVFFTADDKVVGRELWKTNGTSGGTVLVEDIFVSVNPNQSNPYPYGLTNVNDTLYFSAQAHVGFNDDRWLYKSDGTAAGTYGITTNCSSQQYLPLNITKVGNDIFMRNQATDLFCSGEIIGSELLIKKPADSKVSVVKDIFTGTGSSNIDSLTDVNATCFFSATNATSGRELWKSDGTEAGTVIVKNIETGNASSSPQWLTNVSGTLFFTAQNTASGRELWKSDGTTGGTVLVKDILTGAAGSDPTDLTNVDGILYFVANDGINGKELWKSDGTAAGTMLVWDIMPDTSSSNPQNLTSFDGELYFSADDGINGRELWKTKTCAAITTLAGNGITNTQSVANQYFYDPERYVNLIARLVPQNANPINGQTTAKVWVDAVQTPDFVKRHYQIIPLADTNTATAKTTLYFTQQNFDDFNAVNQLKLPTNSVDAAGKANVRIGKYAGTSNDNSGNLNSYTGLASVINPVDGDIVWANSRWEVSFTNTGFGGFILQTKPTALVYSYTFTGNGNWSNAANWANNMVPPASLPAAAIIYINPVAGGQCYLDVPYSASSGVSIIIQPGKNFIIPASLQIQ